MSEFSYLAKSVEAAAFHTDPFKHITLQRFLSPEHFQRVITAKQVNYKHFSIIREAMDTMLADGYSPQEFPGCITDVDEYVAFIEGAAKFKTAIVEGYGRGVIEGYGLTLRLNRYNKEFLQELIDYLNESEFQKAITEKFGITDTVSIETAVQKNMNKYEISPHCDTRRKALTYLINIYTDAECEKEQMHTHLLKPVPNYEYLLSFWKYNMDVDPVWIPWTWCQTTKQTITNNSITIFKPSYDT